LLDPKNDTMLEILLDCTDSSARHSIGDLFKFLLCKVKMMEKDLLASDDHVKTVSAKWLHLLVDNLSIRAAKNWTRFDKFLELFRAFALESERDVLDSM